MDIFIVKIYRFFVIWIILTDMSESCQMVDMAFIGLYTVVFDWCFLLRWPNHTLTSIANLSESLSALC